MSAGSNRVPGEYACTHTLVPGTFVVLRTYESLLTDCLPFHGVKLLISFVLIVACRLSFFFVAGAKCGGHVQLRGRRRRGQGAGLHRSPGAFQRLLRTPHYCSSCNSPSSRLASPGVTSPGVPAGSRFGYLLSPLLCVLFVSLPPPP